MIVESSNISIAWLKTFKSLLKKGVSDITPLVIKVNIENEDVEDMVIRQELDKLLLSKGLNSSGTTANTIFPRSLWRNPDLGREKLFQRYRMIYPMLKKQCRPNQYGTYFGRLIFFGDELKSNPYPINQLDHIIRIYQHYRDRGGIRNTALQATIMNPGKDHTFQKRRGFPCLQHVFFTPHGGEISVTGVYATQNIFDRAYGNYLGLYYLGYFMAFEMGLTLTQLICITSQAKLGNKISKPKTEGHQLVSRIEG